MLLSHTPSLTVALKLTCCLLFLQSLQLSGLRVLSSLCAGACESEVAGEVLVPTQLLDRLLHIIRHSSSPQQVRH